MQMNISFLFKDKINCHTKTTTMSTDSVCEFLNNFITDKDINVKWDVICKLLTCVTISHKYPLLQSLSKLDEESRIKCMELLNKQPEFAARLEAFLNNDGETHASILKAFDNNNYHLFALLVANERIAHIFEDNNFIAFKVLDVVENGPGRVSKYPVREYIYNDITAMLAPLGGVADAILSGNIKANPKLLAKLSSCDWAHIRFCLHNSKVKEDILLQILADRKCSELFSSMMTPSLLEDVIKICMKNSILLWYLPCRVSLTEINKVCKEYPWKESGYYQVTEEAKQCFRALSYYHDNKDKDLLRHLLARLEKACYFDFGNAFGPTLYGTILTSYREYLNE